MTTSGSSSTRRRAAPALLRRPSQTRPTTGPSGGSWKRIPRPARPSWWRSARRCRKSSSRSTWRRRSPKPVAARKPLFARMADDVLLGYGVPTEWLDDVRAATEDTLLALADHLPGEAAEALLELATGGKPRVPQPCAGRRRPVRPPRRQTPLPCHGQRGGNCPRARLSVGQVDGLPAPRAKGMGRTRLCRPGAGFRLGGHG